MKRLVISIMALLCALSSHAFAQKSQFDLLETKVRQAERGHRWKEAIRLSQQIIEKHRDDDYLSDSRLPEIASYHLYLLDFDTAWKVNKKVIDANKDRYGSCSLGLARINVEKGDYPQALTWLKGYANAFGSGCGNCLESRDQFTHIYQTLWKYASLSPEVATAKLKSVAAGNFTPLKGRLTVGSAYKTPAAREANFLLAGMYRRQGKWQDANALYRKLVKGEDDIAFLASAHLQQTHAAR
jgi:hypothetical protein